MKLRVLQMDPRIISVLLCVLMAMFWSPLPVCADDTGQGIVVWRIAAKSGVSEKDIDSISGFITFEVEKASGMKAVSDADIKTMLDGEVRKQQCGADGTSCIAEIGSALGVPEAVSGDLGRMGDYWILNLRRINVRTATVIGRSGKQIKGDVNALIEAIPNAVAELFGKSSTAPPKPETASKPVDQVETSDKPPMSTLNKAAFGTFFSGVGLVALGGIGHWQMDKAKSDGAAGDPDAEDSFNTWKGVAATGYAIGGALMATGAVLWILDASGKKKDGGKTAFQFGVSPTEHGFSACLWGRW